MNKTKKLLGKNNTSDVVYCYFLPFAISKPVYEKSSSVMCTHVIRLGVMGNVSNAKSEESEFCTQIIAIERLVLECKKPSEVIT